MNEGLGGRAKAQTCLSCKRKENVSTSKPPLTHEAYLSSGDRGRLRVGVATPVFRVVAPSRLPPPAWPRKRSAELCGDAGSGGAKPTVLWASRWGLGVACVRARSPPNLQRALELLFMDLCRRIAVAFVFLADEHVYAMPSRAGVGNGHGLPRALSYTRLGPSECTFLMRSGFGSHSHPSCSRWA